MDLYVEVADSITNETLDFSRTVVNGDLTQYSGWTYGQPVGPTYTLSYTNPTTGATTTISHPNGTQKGFGEPIGVIGYSQSVNLTQDSNGFEVENDNTTYDAYVLQGAIVGTATAPANSPPADGPIINTISEPSTTTETFNDGSGNPTQVTTYPGDYMDPYPQYFWVDVGPAPTGGSGGGGAGGNGAPSGPGSTGFELAFDPTTGGFANGETPVLTGSISGASGSASVEIYNGDSSSGGQDLGAATLNGDGTWTFSASIGAGDFTSLNAVASDSAGHTASAIGPYELVTGIAGEPYRAQEFDYSSDGSYGYVDYSRNGTATAYAIDNGDGTHTTFGMANGQVLQSVQNDVMTGGGSSERFVFTPQFGKDEVTDLIVGGRGHDVIDLSGTQFTSLAEVLHHTTMQGGNAEVHVDRHDTITVDGVNRTQLKAHPHDFRLA